MSSLNVLLVTYTFPPSGGVGVLRAASLARYFPAEGIRLDVITARNASAVGADPTLLRRHSERSKYSPDYHPRPSIWNEEGNQETHHETDPTRWHRPQNRRHIQTESA